MRTKSHATSPPSVWGAGIGVSGLVGRLASAHALMCGYDTRVCRRLASASPPCRHAASGPRQPLSCYACRRRVSRSLAAATACVRRVPGFRRARRQAALADDSAVKVWRGGGAERRAGLLAELDGLVVECQVDPRPWPASAADTGVPPNLRHWQAMTGVLPNLDVDGHG